MKTPFKNQFIIFLGLLMIIIFIWLRFIRTRLPRDIPFYPKFLGLIILFFVCFSYLYAIITIYRKPKSNKYFSDIINIVLKPLTVFDDFIKSITSDNLYKWFLKKCSDDLLNPKKTIIKYNIIPRIILLVVFSIDVFLYGELDYIYSIVYLTFLPLLTRYMKYSLKKSLDNNIESLCSKVSSVVTSYVYGVHPSEWPENAGNLDPEDEDDDIPETMSLPLDVFVNYQTTRILNSLEPAKYYILNTKEYYAEYKKQFNIAKMKGQDHNNMDAIITPQIERCIDLSLIIEYYNKELQHDSKVKTLKTFIFVNYFLCWVFILIVTLPHVDWLDIMYVLSNTIFTETNPFSGAAFITDGVIPIQDISMLNEVD